MRALPLFAVLLVGALTLSGCSSKDDGPSSTSGTSSTGTHGTLTGTHTHTNTSAPAPNLPPVVVLRVTNANGTATNVTLAGGNLTFDASASSDPDDGLSQMAIVAQDANQTYAPRVLYANGRFTSATYTFDRPGVVNVTVSAIDVRGNLTTLKRQVYVNEQVTLTSQSIAIPSAGGVPSAPTDCAGPGSSHVGGEGSALDAASFDHQPFTVTKGVQSITATWVAGDGQFAICLRKADGTATAVSGVGNKDTPAQTTGAVQAPQGLDTYEIGFTANAPRETVTVAVVVHYEPAGTA
ncbi:MAG TPA: hypothetical protein VHI93_04250 [Candidatus Thermoplasmatota archaeon]|nr:hypothetical protein [Candidatus Thermoplasmatota archaeon]